MLLFNGFWSPRDCTQVGSRESTWVPVHRLTKYVDPALVVDIKALTEHLHLIMRQVRSNLTKCGFAQAGMFQNEFYAWNKVIRK